MRKMDYTIALVGNPNCGKTTLFNALTGARQRVGNWPGVTVEKKCGEYRHDGRRFTDLYCADAGLCARLEAKVREDTRLASLDIRVIHLRADSATPHARTVIPRQNWGNVAFLYVGLEIGSPEYWVMDG